MAWSVSAAASDGVLEINQTCAEQTGCFAGDTAGLPVTINGNAGKSYRLTSDLVVPDQNTDGIQVSADNVSIDLGGFEIRGVVVCSGTPLVCVPNSVGTGAGIESTEVSLSGISVRNGSIRGMGYEGVSLGVQSEVTNLRVRSNRRHGILAWDGTKISGNTSYQNGGSGIFAWDGTVISGNTANQNGSNGILAGAGTIISGNMAKQNGSDGISVDDGSMVSGNTVFENVNYGIVTNKSTVSGNTAFKNGSDGIFAGFGSTVWGNTVRSNTGFGLNLGADTLSGYRENVISDNGGTVTGGFNLGDNLCNGAPCPATPPPP